MRQSQQVPKDRNGHRLRNRFDYGDVVEVSEPQLESVIAGAQDLLDDFLRVFLKVRP
jgi:hypothetical protein